MGAVTTVPTILGIITCGMGTSSMIVEDTASIPMPLKGVQVIISTAIIDSTILDSMGFVRTFTHAITCPHYI
jgi:hypothetical protein